MSEHCTGVWMQEEIKDLCMWSVCLFYRVLSHVLCVMRFNSMTVPFWAMSSVYHKGDSRDCDCEISTQFCLQGIQPKDFQSQVFPRHSVGSDLSVVGVGCDGGGGLAGESVGGEGQTVVAVAQQVVCDKAWHVRSTLGHNPRHGHWACQVHL